MYGFEDEEKTRDKTNDVEDNNFIPTNTKQKYTNYKNTNIETIESKISEESSNENQKIYINEESESNKSINKKIPERGIPLNIKEINESYFINKLKKKFVNKKGHKQNKKKAYNQYKTPNSQYNININNFSPFQMNQMNIQGQNYNSNNYMNNNYMQNNQNMNKNNQIRFNNYGINNNMNMNNFNQNQNIPPQQNMAAMQQVLLSMQNMNLNRNMNNQNRYNMNMMNNMNNSNNMQNQNQNFRINGINLPFPDLIGNGNSDNQEEIRIIRIIRQNTENGQKVTKVQYKTTLVKNDKKKINKK